MSTDLATLKRFSNVKDFLSYRRSTNLLNEPMDVRDFGFGLYEQTGFIYPEQRDHWWDPYEDSLVWLDKYRIMTNQLEVYATTVEHYLLTPLLASGKGNTQRDGLIPHALVSETTKTIYLAEGNHRCAAASISHRPILMKLAPLTKVEPSSTMRETQELKLAK